VVRIGAGANASFALLVDGGITSWGDDNVTLFSATPRPTGLFDAGLRDVGLSLNHGCVTQFDGRLACFGRGAEGQLGFATTATSGVLPTVVAMGPVRSACVGNLFSCAVLTDGGARCFGDNTWGQLGTGNLAPSSSPVAVSGLPPADQIACHSHSVCATTASGVYCWGDNSLGQLGSVTPASSTMPLQVSLP
jgi:alpha-tubulin suppressor-like RCC1 family protein